MKFIDTHAHIFKQYYNESEKKEQWKMLHNSDLEKVILVGIDKETSLEAMQISKENDFAYFSIGVHPSESKNINELNFMEDIIKLKEKDLVALGETGIDLHWDDNPNLIEQIKCFECHLKLGMKYKLPVIIHSRDSFEEVYKVLTKEEFKGVKFIMHSFSGDIEWAQKFINLGGLISFSGIVTFKTAKIIHDTVKQIDINKIMVETDSPYLTPVPYRGKVNSPIYVAHIIDAIALIKNISNDELAKTIYKTTTDFFNFDK